MSKRGETRPWRVRYAWSNGVAGTVTFRTEEDAQVRADEIKRAAELRDLEVDVVVEERRA